MDGVEASACSRFVHVCDINGTVTFLEAFGKGLHATHKLEGCQTKICCTDSGAGKKELHRIIHPEPMPF